MKAENLEDYIKNPTIFKEKKVVIMLGGNDVCHHWKRNKTPNSPAVTALCLGSFALLLEQRGFDVYVVAVLLREGGVLPIMELNSRLEYLFEDRYIRPNQRFEVQNFVQ